MLESIPIARRAFLKTLTMATAAAAVSPLIGRETLADSGSYTSVGKLSDFKVGDYSRVALPDGTTLYVERSPSDPSAAVALSSVCPRYLDLRVLLAKVR